MPRFAPEASEVPGTSLAPAWHQPGTCLAPASIALATQFVVSTLWAVIVWWMGGGARQPAAEVHAVFRRLASPGLELTLKD